jgi:hypothetical protein
MEKISFGQRFNTRPVKSAGKRRQRIKMQKRRLVAAGMDTKAVAKLTIKQIRESLKRLKV